MFVGNEKKVMGTLRYDFTQKKLAKSCNFLYGFTSLSKYMQIRNLSCSLKGQL